MLAGLESHAPAPPPRRPGVRRSRWLLPALSGMLVLGTLYVWVLNGGARPERPAPTIVAAGGAASPAGGMATAASRRSETSGVTAPAVAPAVIAPATVETLPRAAAALRPEPITTPAALTLAREAGPASGRLTSGSERQLGADAGVAKPAGMNGASELGGVARAPSTLQQPRLATGGVAQAPAASVTRNDASPGAPAAAATRGDAPPAPATTTTTTTSTTRTTASIVSQPPAFGLGGAAPFGGPPPPSVVALIQPAQGAGTPAAIAADSGDVTSPAARDLSTLPPQTPVSAAAEAGFGGSAAGHPSPPRTDPLASVAKPSAGARPGEGAAGPSRPGAPGNSADADVEILAAMVGHLRRSDAGGSASRATEANGGRLAPATIAELVSECKALGGRSEVRCRQRICEGYWGKADACPQPARRTTKVAGPRNASP
jgi:hypothetical protein